MSCLCLSHLIYTLANVAALSLCQARLITNGGHLQSVREATVKDGTGQMLGNELDGTSKRGVLSNK